MATKTAVETKQCPRCAEQIASAAVVCRFCQYDYATGSARQVVQQVKNNGLAIASLVLGIVWVYGVGSLLAVIFGHVSRKQIAESQGAQTGKGMATAGLVLGYLGLAGLVFIILAFFFLAQETSATFSCTAQSIIDQTGSC